MIVVDTNVIVYLMIESEKTQIAQQAYRRDPGWAVPPLWRHEFLNVLATFVRHGGMEIDAALDTWQESTHLFTPAEQEVDMFQALRLASQHNISAYDAQYVALAMQLSVPYLTEDQQILKAFPDLAVSLQEFSKKRQGYPGGHG